MAIKSHHVAVRWGSFISSTGPQIFIYDEIYDRNRTDGVSGKEMQLEKNLVLKNHTCFVFGDVSSMETNTGEENEDHDVTLGGCADDVNILDAIETCRGVQPRLLSDHFIDRRHKVSGKWTHLYALLLHIFPFLAEQADRTAHRSRRLKM